MQVAGIIAGQLSLGFLADRLMWMWRSVTTGFIMLVDGILILSSAGTSPHSIFLVCIISQVSLTGLATEI